MKEVVQAEAQIHGKEVKTEPFVNEDVSKVKAAIFYSIASTQKGLQVSESTNL